MPTSGGDEIVTICLRIPSGSSDFISLQMRHKVYHTPQSAFQGNRLPIDFQGSQLVVRIDLITLCGVHGLQLILLVDQRVNFGTFLTKLSSLVSKVLRIRIPLLRGRQAFIRFRKCSYVKATPSQSLLAHTRPLSFSPPGSTGSALGPQVNSKRLSSCQHYSKSRPSVLSLTF